jgi:hypothetical protein
MVSLLKLKNGMEIIGYIKRLDKSILVEDPMQVNYKSVDYSALPVISFSRYCPFSSEDLFSFDLDFVLHVTPVKKSLEDYYAYAVNHHKEVVIKHIDEELYEAVSSKPSNDDQQLKDYLRKVKIDGYAQ